MTALKIVADENIPKVRTYFDSLGQVELVNGRQLDSQQVKHADILLVRSVTSVNRQLLAGSDVRFVATATIGIDHLDTDYLDAQGIAWTNAPGCNADSVVDYVISALCRLDNVIQRLLDGGRLGIIGMGNVGSRLYQRLHCLGVRCNAYDPLIAQDQYPVLGTLDEVLSCDVVCCHAPLTTQGRFPSRHMINKARLSALKPNAALINAGRGAVLDNLALKQVLEQRDDLHVVLDVWENEPSIDLQLLAEVDLGSPHIAGYSLDGKIAGTESVYRACCRYLRAAVGTPATQVHPYRVLKLSNTQSLVEGVREAVLSSYDIAEDDKALRDSLLDSNNPALQFDRLRKHYPVRREFSRFRIGNTQELDDKLYRALAALGFDLGTT